MGRNNWFFRPYVINPNKNEISRMENLSRFIHVTTVHTFIVDTEKVSNLGNLLYSRGNEYLLHHLFYSF